ncbi:hypothetical protein F2P56_023089 [Juglans regia]|uniref:Disease resistance RPP13-like protein 1 n=2 Tax=Juglans regia TaxID=51240 RepID=A0A2I4DRX2_JUGRE|nr:putative disease resistance RPP13-like protein 1 [Juglans regia]KAF5459105.1 hypothetical protein F2P56_023089 [Juglans regia]
MAEVGMAFLSSFLGVIFNKMASPVVVDFICRQKSTDELLKKMEISLRSMNMVLEDAEEKEVTNPNVKMWIDDPKDVAYTAEDILDEIATEALQRQLLVEFKPVAGKEDLIDREITINKFYSGSLTAFRIWRMITINKFWAQLFFHVYLKFTLMNYSNL